MVTTQTADNALKSYYLDIVSDQLNLSANPLLAKIGRTTADVWGKDVRKLVRYGVNGGIGAGTEEGALPSAGGNRYAQFTASLKNLYGTVEISDKAIRASANNEGAFVNLLNDEMEGLVKSSSFNFGRMLFGDGSGKLATVTLVSGTEYTVDSVIALAEGMIVDLYASGSAIATGRTVVAVDRSAKKNHPFGRKRNGRERRGRRPSKFVRFGTYGLGRDFFRFGDLVRRDPRGQPLDESVYGNGGRRDHRKQNTKSDGQGGRKRGQRGKLYCLLLGGAPRAHQRIKQIQTYRNVRIRWRVPRPFL